MIDHLESLLLTPGGQIPLLVAEASTSNTFFILLIYSICIVGAAIFGGWLPYVVRLTHTWMQLLISLVGGLILGIAIFHLLPHSLAELGPDGVDTMATCLMAGLLVMFLLLRAFHFHHHEPVVIPDAESAQVEPSHTHSTAELDDAEKLAAKAIAAQLLNPPPSNLPALPVLSLAPVVDTSHHSSCDHSHDHHGGHHHGHQHGDNHDHHHGHDHHSHSHRPFGQRWIPVMFGLCLHSMLDGLAVAASVEADVHHGHGGLGGLFGIGTFLAVLLHPPLDAMSISALLGSNRWSPSTRLLIVAGFAAMCPLGAYLFWAGYQLTGGSTGVVVGGSLAFAAGLFLCISLSDLLPEMEFHSHNRIQLTAALLAGIGIAYAIGFLEPHHAHHFEEAGIVSPEGGREVPDSESEHDDAGHDHAGHDHAGHSH